MGLTPILGLVWPGLEPQIKEKKGPSYYSTFFNPKLPKGLSFQIWGTRFGVWLNLFRNWPLFWSKKLGEEIILQNHS